LGFSLKQLSSKKIQDEAFALEELSKSVLLEGDTDPPQRKITSNGYDFSGSASQSDIERGVVCCAIGGLPLFTSLGISPITASSGWLSFSQPLSEDHVVLVEPL
jgi:peptide methionine sulfoxide reductase MsrB